MKFFDREEKIAKLRAIRRKSVSEAQFTINVHELRWVVDGETLHKDSLPYGAPIEAWEVPVREGQTFSGWSSYPETMPDRDVTVVGSFDANTYTITYMVDGEVYQTVQAAYGSPLILIEEPVKEGYTFSGWGYYPATMPAENIIVSGSFSVNQYLLTIVFDGVIPIHAAIGCVVFIVIRHISYPP